MTGLSEGGKGNSLIASEMGSCLGTEDGKHQFVTEMGQTGSAIGYLLSAECAVNSWRAPLHQVTIPL